MKTAGHLPISVIHTAGNLHTRLGGPSQTIPGLVKALRALPDMHARLVTQILSSEADDLDRLVDLQADIATTTSRLALRLGGPLTRALQTQVAQDRPMLIHDHGVWLPSNHRIAALARRLAIPLVLHPRGMLEPWAMAFRPQKKRLALALYQRRDLESVGMFVATAAPEAENLRALGLRQPIAVIPNGIPTEMLVTPVRSASTARHPRQALFLSRVHPKKGLLNLIEAWAAVKPDGWQLVIAGPDENQHLQQVMALASTRGVSHLVKYVGEVKGQRKQQVYADADLFVLPTFSENFGVVVAEAMAHSLPVITTHGTPWSELPRQKCGWWIEVGAEPLAHALRDATALPPAEREAMGQRARETVQRYNWEAIAAHMQQAYEWLVRGGQRPGCIWAD